MMEKCFRVLIILVLGMNELRAITEPNSTP